MRSLFKDYEHLARLAILFVAGAVVFLVARAVMVPKDFGEYGHFRAGAMDDVAARPLHYAGHAACLDCHDDVGAVKSKGKHAGVNCEACHGALAAHVADPQAVVPEKLDVKTLCVVCHLKNSAKPRSFPQIDPKEHADDTPCDQCHNPHSPLES